MKINNPKRYWAFLLLVPYAPMLWVGLYNVVEPRLFGFPFFYWFQLICIPIGSLVIWFVYRLTKSGS